jgi:hypothetical protein
VRQLAILTILCSMLTAQSAIRVPYTCTLADLDAFGLTCTPEEPCPVYAELVSVEALGGRLFVTGNLHTVSATLYGLLLQSDDGGKTWTEPVKRDRWTAFEQIQFADLEHGWVSGVTIQPLPKDPFLLITSNAGTTWRARPLFEESRYGSIQQFWFENAKTGELIVDRSQGANQRYERYETQGGGDSWEAKEVSNKPIKLLSAKPRENPTWRLRTDPASKTFRVEQRTSDGWSLSASFEIHVGDCKGTEE